jgi:hypothetical protein
VECVGHRVRRPDGDQGLFGQREGRTGAAVVDWLAERSPQFREGIEYVAIDPAAVYASAIRTEGLLPNATIVVDHFHPVKLANDALTNVRRRVTWDLRDRRGRKRDPEWANRRRLLRARERLSKKSFATMWNEITAEDPSAQIHHRLDRERSCAPCWRPCVSAATPPDPPPANRFLTCASTANPDYSPSPRSTPAARDPRFLQTGITNARTEGTTGAQTGQARRLRIPNPKTRHAGYDSTAPANGGPQPRLHAYCPVKSKSRHIELRSPQILTSMNSSLRAPENIPS